MLEMTKSKYPKIWKNIMLYCQSCESYFSCWMIWNYVHESKISSFMYKIFLQCNWEYMGFSLKISSSFWQFCESILWKTFWICLTITSARFNHLPPPNPLAKCPPQASPSILPALAVFLASLITILDAASIIQRADFNGNPFGGCLDINNGDQSAQWVYQPTKKIIEGIINEMRWGDNRCMSGIGCGYPEFPCVILPA